MNDDLMIAFAEVTQNNKQILKIMKGNTKVWPSGDIAVIYIKQLDNATCDINQLRVSLHSQLTGTLVPNTDCVMINIIITMGGVDITSSAYDSSDGSISIEEVTGDIIITAIASPVIVFADSTVKSLCVTNWGGNYLSGEITEWEAAQVTSLNSVFFRNSQISTFDELRYFTGLTGFNTGTGGQGQFYNCIALTSVILPQLNLDTANLDGLFCVCPVQHIDLTPIKANTYNIHYIVRSASQQNWLKDITFPSGRYVARAAPNIFANQKGLTTIAIQGTADWSGIPDYRGCFSNCTSLTTITGNIVGINPTTSGQNSISLQWSPSLTRASAMVLINGLAQTATPKKITFHWNTFNLLTADDIAIANAKGWNVETYVQFEDANLKAFILEQFPDNVGKASATEITNLELGSITSLGGKFRGLVNFNSDSSKPFYTFNELRFFIGLSRLHDATTGGEFYGCTNLMTVSIPPAPITIASEAFRDCSKITSVDLSPITSDTLSMARTFMIGSNDLTLTYVKLPSTAYSGHFQNLFYRRSGLTTLEIDGNADWSGISSYPTSFYNCTSLTTIIGTITGIKGDISFQYSPLDKPSALMLLNGLAQVATTKKITFSYYTYNLLSETDLAIATNKGWQVETIIEWEDNNLRDYILEQFPNNVGLTYSGQITNLELASITSLNNKFVNLAYFDENNTKPFYTFNEFRFFTGLTGFSPYANAQGQFYNCNKLQSILLPTLNINGSLDLRALFRGCYSLTSVDFTPFHAINYWIYYLISMPSTQTSLLTEVTLPSGTYGSESGGGTYARSAFAYCRNLTTINIDGIADFSGIASYQTDDLSAKAFGYCYALTTINGTITGIKTDIYFENSPLTHDTALMLLNGLYDLTGGTQQTITFSASTYATLTAEDIAIATNKNWQVASA